MSYFQALSVTWGILMVGVRLLIHLIPKKWADFELNAVYTEEKPKWVWAIGVFSVLIVIITWYKELTTEIRYSLVLTILITLTLIKVSQLLFNYSKFREFVRKALVDDRSIVVKINIATTIIGIVLILLGIFLY